MDSLEPMPTDTAVDPVRNPPVPRQRRSRRTWLDAYHRLPSGAPAERSDVIGTSQTAASHRGQPRRYASTADTRRSVPGSRSSLAKMLPTCLRTAASLTKSRCAIEPFVRP